MANTLSFAVSFDNGHQMKLLHRPAVYFAPCRQRISIRNLHVSVSTYFFSLNNNATDNGKYENKKNTIDVDTNFSLHSTLFDALEYHN